MQTPSKIPFPTDPFAYVPHKAPTNHYPELFERGKKYRRKAWLTGTSIAPVDTEIRWNSGIVYVPSVSDIEATDWEVI